LSRRPPAFRKLGQPIPLKEMISLTILTGYPGDARESAEEQGATVELPDNFYSLVASSHLKSEQEAVKQVVIPGEKTVLLFYDHPSTRSRG